jgi:hypothetical protein
MPLNWTKTNEGWRSATMRYQPLKRVTVCHKHQQERERHVGKKSQEWPYMTTLDNTWLWVTTWKEQPNTTWHRTSLKTIKNASEAWQSATTWQCMTTWKEHPNTTSHWTSLSNNRVWWRSATMQDHAWPTVRKSEHCRETSTTVTDVSNRPRATIHDNAWQIVTTRDNVKRATKYDLALNKLNKEWRRVPKRDQAWQRVIKS